MKLLWVLSVAIQLVFASAGRVSSAHANHGHHAVKLSDSSDRIPSKSSSFIRESKKFNQDLRVPKSSLFSINPSLKVTAEAVRVAKKKAFLLKSEVAKAHVEVLTAAQALTKANNEIRMARARVAELKQAAIDAVENKAKVAHNEMIKAKNMVQKAQRVYAESKKQIIQMKKIVHADSIQAKAEKDKINTIAHRDYKIKLHQKMADASEMAYKRYQAELAKELAKAKKEAETHEQEAIRKAVSDARSKWLIERHQKCKDEIIRAQENAAKRIAAIESETTNMLDVLAKNTENRIKTTEEQAKRKIAEVEEIAKEKVETVKQQMVEVKQVAKQEIATVKETAQQQVAVASEKAAVAQEKAAVAQEKVAVVQEKIEAVKQQLVEVKQVASEKVAVAQEKVAEIKQQAQEKIAEIKENVQSQVETIKEKAQVAVKLIQDHAKEVVTQQKVVAEKKAEKKIKKARETISQQLKKKYDKLVKVVAEKVATAVQSDTEVPVKTLISTIVASTTLSPTTIAPTTDSPVVATRSPVVATQFSDVSTAAPTVVATADPVVATQFPDVSTAAPTVVATADPVVATQSPDVSTVAPVVATVAPVVATASQVVTDSGIVNTPGCSCVCPATTPFASTPLPTVAVVKPVILSDTTPVELLDAALNGHIKTGHGKKHAVQRSRVNKHMVNEPNQRGLLRPSDAAPIGIRRVEAGVVETINAPVKAPRKVPVKVAAPAKVPVKVVAAVKAPVKVAAAVKAPIKVAKTPVKVAKTPVKVVKAPVKAVAVVKAPVKAVAVVKAPVKAVAVVRAPVKAVVVAVKAPVKAPVKVPFGFVTATASGDPHIDTFDGVHHDTMVAGWFTWVKNDAIHIQAYSQRGCVSNSNTCLRSFMIELTPPGTTDRMVLSWGRWRGSVQNVVIRDSMGASVDTPFDRFSSGTYLNGLYSVSRSGSSLTIRPTPKAITNPALAISVTMGHYYLAVTLPNSMQHKGRTNGLMGFYSGSRSQVFRTRDGTRVYSMHTRGSWAATYAVTGASGPNPPIKMDNSVSPVARSLLQVEESDSKEFSPFPREMPVVIHNSIAPVITKKTLAFCKSILKGIVSPKKMAVQMHSCLQDAENPSVARSIASVIRVAKVQQEAAKKSLKAAVKKQESIIKAVLARVKASNEDDDDDDDDDDDGKKHHVHHHEFHVHHHAVPANA